MTIDKQDKSEQIKDPVLRAEFDRIQADLRVQKELRSRLMSIRARAAARRSDRPPTPRNGKSNTNDK